MEIGEAIKLRRAYLAPVITQQ